MNQKIPATIREQVQKLRQRGCIIEDEKALRGGNYL